MFEALTDVQLTALHSVLSEELDERRKHYPDEESQEHWDSCREMRAAVSEEAYRRRRLPGGYQTFWWARA